LPTIEVTDKNKIFEEAKTDAIRDAT